MPVEQLTFTDLPRGQGLDPSAAGYQIRACSPGLGADARKALGGVALHYGEAVYRAAPAAALEKETQWRTRAADIDRVPDDVLAAFPVVWSYDRLADDLFALTRVSYRGLTHDGRFGNFLAHSLVFAPSALAKCGSNPLALRRSKLFPPAGPADVTTLPDPAAVAADADVFAPLRAAPLRDHLPALLRAVAAAPGGKPVLLTLPDEVNAERVVEALLALVPPTARARTTFCTHEPDRNWALSGAPHHVFVLARPDGVAPTLRADETQTAYAAFNLVGGQVSSVAPSAFSNYATAAVLAERTELVAKLHDAAERLGLGGTAAAWDRLTAAAPLWETADAAAALPDAAAALAELAPGAEALALLLPHVQTAAEADRFDVLTRAAASLATIVDKADAGGTLRPTAQALIGRGKVRTAAALVAACGKDRAAARTAALTPPPAAPTEPAEASALFDLAAEELPTSAVEPLVLLAFDAAARANRAGEAWDKLAAKHVRPRLEAKWDAAAEGFVRRLQKVLPPTSSPRAAAELSTRVLDGKKPKGDELVAELTTLVRAGAGCASPEEYGEQAVEVAGAHIKNPPDLAVALGRLADAAHGTALAKPLFEAFESALPDKAKAVGEVRYRLAAAGAANVLAASLLAAARPWEDDKTPDIVKRWRADVAACPAAADAACAAVAGRLKTHDADGLHLARQLLKTTEKGTPRPGAAELWARTVATLPVAPLSAEWDAVLAPHAPAGDARYGLLRFLAEVDAEAAKGWSPAAFPVGRAEWAAVPAADRAAAVAAVVGSFRAAGVPSPADAAALFRLLTEAGAEAEFVRSVGRLTENRDAVTTVLTVAAVVDAGAEADGEAWAAAARQLVASLDKPTAKLLADHLDRRGGTRTDAEVRRVNQFRERLDLPQADAPAAGVTKWVIGWVLGRSGK